MNKGLDWISGTFDDFRSQTPKCQQELLGSVEILVRPYEFVEYMNGEDEVLIVSHGSVPDKRMSYRLIIETIGVIELAYVSVPVWGTPSLHREESLGMFAGPILLDQLTKYTGVDIKDTKMTVYSDNKGLITRECEKQRFNINYPSETLRLNWDVTEKIHTQ